MAPILRHPSFDPPGPGSAPTPLHGAEDALTAVRLAASDPPRPETVVLFLDDAHVGRSCCIVSGTTTPDDVLEVGALAADVAGRSPDLHAVVLATMRAGRAAGARAGDGGRAGVDPEDDALRWGVLLDLFDDAGVELLDWFVVGHDRDARSLREHTGMPSAWDSP